MNKKMKDHIFKLCLYFTITGFNYQKKIQKRIFIVGDFTKDTIIEN